MTDDNSQGQNTNEQKIQELQFLEQNLQNIFYQKQSTQIELSEANSALKELENSGDDVYKIVGQLMIKADKETTKKELSEKKETLEKRHKQLEEQEQRLSEKISSLRGEIK